MIIIILSVEGLDSNTEINFFKNFSNHFPEKIKLEAFAIGKCGKDENSINKFLGKLRRTISLFPIPKDNEDMYIFFVGDSDVTKDIPSMERARDKFIVEWEQKYSEIIKCKKIEQEILMPINEKNLEDVLSSAMLKDGTKCSLPWVGDEQKSKSRVTIFNEYWEHNGLPFGDIVEMLGIMEEIFNHQTKGYELLFKLLKNNL